MFLENGIEQSLKNVAKSAPISAVALLPCLVKRYIIDSDRNILYKVEFFGSRRSPTEGMRFSNSRLVVG
jgi:hypothetical protein